MEQLQVSLRGAKTIGTKTPGCFYDPIEVFFGNFDHDFIKSYLEKIVKFGVYHLLTRRQIKNLILASMESAMTLN